MTTADNGPPPLTPTDCNLQDFKFMPVDVDRVLNSDTWQLATDAEKVAAITLWFKAWRQVPAASLPNNDRVLAHLSGAKTWPKVREQAMRGWRLCSDGRYYHPVVAEKALEAWVEKLVAAVSGSSGNAKRWGLQIDVSATMGSLQEAIGMLRALAPQSRTLRKKALVAAAAGIAPGSPPDGQKPSPPDPPRSPPDASAASPPDSPPDRKGQGQGQGQGLGSIPTLTGGSDPPAGGPPDTLNGKGLNGHGLNGHGAGIEVPDCDHQHVLQLWTQLVPTNPKPERWTKARQGHLRARWRELFAEGKAHTEQEALQWFSKYFRWIAKSKFLTGRVPGTDGRPPFEARLDWVLSPDNLAKILEGEYHREE